MNRLLLLLAGLSLCLGLAAGTAHRGRILDESGRGVERALLSDGVIQVFSAADGSFRFETSADSVSVSRLGYKSVRMAVKDLSQPVYLTVDPIQLPGVTVTETSLDVFSASADLVSLPVDPDRHYYSAGELLGGSTAVRSADIRLKGERQSVSILGNLARHSLIILDGIPLNPGGESYDLSLLDTDNIESVEVIKNNASAYGGGSAIGGILRLTTRQGGAKRELEASLNQEFGSFAYARTAFTARTALSSWNLRLRLARFGADNDFGYKVPDWWAPDSTATRANNAKRQLSASLGTSLRGENYLVSLQSDFEDFRRQLPGTVNFLEVYRQARLTGQANRNRISLETQPWGLSAQATAWLNLDDTVYDNTRAPLPVFVSKYRQKLRAVGLKGTLNRELKLRPGLAVNAGLAAEAGSNRFQNLDLLHTGADLDHSSEFANLSLKTGYQTDRGIYSWASSAALRYDLSDREDNFSWRLEGSLSRYGRLETTLGGTWGTSFALPSAYDLYWKGDSQALGNPDLDSERSRGWQLWLENSLGPFSLKAAWHHNSIETLIQWRQVQMFGNVWKPLNIGEARIRNLELEASLKPRDWLSLALSALRTEALDLSQLPAEAAPELMYTPDLTLSASLDLKLERFGLWAKYSHTGRQYTTLDNLVNPLKAYSLLDLGLTAQFSFRDYAISPYVSVLNLLDRRYEVYAYVPQPGRSVYGGLSLSFRTGLN